MYVNFFDTVIYAESPEAILTACHAARPALSGELHVVARARPTGSDVYQMRGAVHTGFAVADGETYSHIYE